MASVSVKYSYIACKSGIYFREMGMKLIRKIILSVVSILLLSGSLHIKAKAENTSIDDMRLIKNRLREYVA